MNKMIIVIWPYAQGHVEVRAIMPKFEKLYGVYTLQTAFFG